MVLIALMLGPRHTIAVFGNAITSIHRQTKTLFFVTSTPRPSSKSTSQHESFVSQRTKTEETCLRSCSLRIKAIHRRV